jgi:hypothetical protein
MHLRSPAMTRIARLLPVVAVLAWSCLGRPECPGWGGECAVEEPAERPAADRPPACDDGNPCTLDAWCMPCELVPDPSLYTCGGYLDSRLGTPLASWCPPAARGCEHTTSVDGGSCFPAPGDDEPLVGTCLAGACVADG